MKSLVTFLLLLLSWPAIAQGWRQTFEGVLSPAAVRQTPDGGAVFVSNTVHQVAQGRQIALTKTDQDGRLQWQRRFGGPGDDEGRSLILTAEGNIAVSGRISYMANNGDALLALFDLGGQLIWERIYNYGVLDDARCVRQLPDGGFILAVEADNQLRLLRTDATGLELWTKAYPATFGLIVKHLEIRSDTGFVVTLLRNTLPIGAPSAVVIQFDAAGNLETQATLPHFTNYVTTEQLRCKPASDSTYWLMHRDSVYLLNQDTLVLKKWRVLSPPDLYLTDLLPDEHGGVYILGTQYSFSGTAYNKTFFAHFQSDGTELWRRVLDAPSNLHATWAAARANDGGFFLSGNYALNGANFSYLLRTDSLGQAFTNQISGEVYWDRNNDCEASADDPALAGWLLKITRPNGDLHYANTDSSGHYRIEAGLGTHKLSILLPNGLWTADCAQDEIVVFDAPFQSRNLDFPIKNTAFCPLPRVDAGLDYWLHCAENTLELRYANAGTAVVQNAAVLLRLDSLLSLTGASQVFDPTGPQQWRFPLGDLEPLASGSISAIIQTDCGMETLDRTLCVEASMEPDELCLSPLDGPLLVADGACEGDSIRFRVRNIGLPMLEALPYIVVEDNIMFVPGGGNLQLGAGEELVLRFPATGSTWRIEVLQSPSAPDWLSEQRVAAVVEACGANGGFSMGYVNQFSLYDGGYFAETECRPVVANAQGREKVAFPRGLGDDRLVPPNTDLEYALHFQNTSGDSVLALTLRDTLDHLLLDPGTVLPGPSSHPYQFDLSGQGVLNFRFMGIALPDSGRAWVKFRVGQQPDLPYGTVIFNRAWAYPDFDVPLSTNETFHTIGAPLLVGSSEPKIPRGTALQVWPVPSYGELNLELPRSGDYVCRISDMTGRMVLERRFSGNRLSLTHLNIQPGVYFAAVFERNKRVGHARIVVLKP